MNAKKTNIILLAVIMALATIFSIGCKTKNDDSGFKKGDEVGSYYCIVNGEESTLTISDEGTVTLVLGEETISGTCDKEKSSSTQFTLTFGESEVAQASYGKNILVVTFRSTEYRYLRDINFTVTFDSMGGSTVASKQVRHGETVSKPEDPTYGNKPFIGWYKDKEGNMPYSFDGEAVTEDLTLYAVYGNVAETEFMVTFNPNYDGAEITTVKTENGVVTMPKNPQNPDSSVFLGWYVSDYDDPTKLTYKYEGQTIKQDTILFAGWKNSAPTVSVSGDVISWNSLGLGTYSVYVYSQNGELLVSETTTTTKYEYAFSSQPAGEYKINVSYRGQTGSAYLKNKVLARVSNFQVTNGTALTYNPVENATEYLITIDCGNKAHKHTMLSNGNSTTYNFANCDMQAEGINFSVTATASGYMSSTSKVFNFYQGLESVKGLKVDGDTGIVTWDAVENATSYTVTVITADGEKVHHVSNQTISIKDYGVGDITISVQPKANNYYSPDAVSITYAKTTLACPTNIMLNEKTLVWDNVEGATYKVKIGDKVVSTSTNSLVLDESNFDGMDKWTVQVQLEVGGKSSLYSQEIEISNLAKMTADLIKYQDGVVTWGNVFGAERFRVTVGTNEPMVLDASTHSTPVTFTRSGEYTIQVAAYGNKIDSTAASIEVSVYTVYYESNGGTIVNSQIVAEGDHLTLPESIKGGYNFDGWYNSVGGASSNGKQYEDGIFTLKNDVTMYANWTPKPFNVTLNWKDGGEQLTDTVQVYYNEKYTLPVPQIEPNGYAFSGWYLGSVKYTDELGNALAKYDRISDVTLTANFVEALVFTYDELSDGYAVSAGNYISLVTEVTIPATYNGKKVTTIASGAFKSSSKLVTLNIPDTIEYIFVGIEGINQTGSAFQGCTLLRNINIYETGSATGEVGPYWSVDGIVYRNNEVTNAVELFAVPYAKSGTVVIADGVETITSNTFKYLSKINTVVFPASVKSIEYRAFYSNTNLTSVVFEETPEGDEVVPLEIETEAFYICSNLLEATLPSRLTNFAGNIFRSCSKLATINVSGDGGNYYSDDGIVYSKDELGVVTLVYFPIARGGEFTIPSGVTRIGDLAFTTRFENTTSTITPFTYYGNTKLTEITIPGYVTYIGEVAFRACTALERINFLGTITDNPLTIANEAFYGITDDRFTTVTLPGNLVSLGAGAFGNCTKLLTVNLNSYDCSGFETGAFGTVTTSTTAPTYYVTTLNIGPNASAIEIAGVFGPKLIKVNVDPTNENYSVIDNVVYDKAVTNILFYPAEKEGEYVTPETLTSIGANVFRDRDGLTSIVIGKNVTSIGDEAFYDCDELVSVIFEDGGSSELVLGNGVFTYCSLIENITLPERLTQVGSELFYYCNSLETVSLPSTLQSIKFGYDSTLKKDIFNMFSGTSSSVLRAINVSESNANYGSLNGMLFEKDTDGNLVTLLFCPSSITGVIDIPNTVTKIGEKAFAYSQAERLTFSQGIEQGATLIFGEQAFYSSEISKIDLPEGLTEITDRMFYYSESLVSITIPSTVTRIGEYAFYYCKALESIVIPNSVTEIGDKAFNYCTSLTSITFEEGNDAKNPDGTYVNPLVFANAKSTSSSSLVASPGALSNTAITELIFPRRTTHIANNLMYGYSSSGNQTLKRVVIPMSIEYLGARAFYYCEGLETVEFVGEGLSKLADRGPDYDDSAIYYTFYGCKSLRSINIPESSAEAGYSIYGGFSYSNLKEVVVPASVKSMTSAFNYSKNLQKVTFAENSKLKSISSCFSSAVNLHTIILPDGLETINYSAFSGLKALTSIVIPKTVTSIGYNAFLNCTSLSDIVFATFTEGENMGKTSLVEIDYKAFANTALTTFTFPESISGDVALGGGTTNIDYKGRLFYNCYGLTTVTLSHSIKNIEYVFKDCPNLTTIIIPDGHENFKTVSGEPYIYNAEGTGILYVFGILPAGKFEIKEGILEIAPYVFDGQDKITEIHVPYTVEKIGDGAFANCQGLERVVFENTPEKPSALKQDHVGVALFKDCKNLKEVVLPTSEQFTTIPEDTFNGSGLTSFEIPANIVEIGPSAFEFCNNLTSLTFAKGSKLATIGNYAFRETAFETISLPSSLKTIGTYAFISNVALREVIFEKDENGNTSLTTIGNYAFGYLSMTSTTYTPCISLESIVIPKSVTKLQGYTFYNCTSLRSIVFEEGTTLTAFGYSAFRNTAIETFVVPQSITTFDNYIFSGCANLRTVIFDEASQLKTIGNYVFQNCTSLESIAIPDTVTSLGTYVFMGCENLTSVKLSQNLTQLQSYTFTNCKSLPSIAIPDSITKIGNYAFSGCELLETVTFGENSQLVSFGTYVFAGYGTTANSCISLRSIAIPDGVTALGNYMFMGCTALETVTFGEGSQLTFLGQSTFRDSGLQSIVIPDGVTELGTSATSCTTTGSAYTFAGCKNLTSVTFLGEVTKIGAYVFYGCSSLTMDIPQTVTLIGKLAFAGTSATNYTIPAGLSSGSSSIGDGAFAYNTKLTGFTIAEGNTDFKVDPATGALSVPNADGTQEFICFPASLAGDNGTITINSGDTIRGYAFAGCDKITQIVLPDDMTALNNYTFYDATGLTSITIPAGITKIGSSYSSGYMFSGCTSLTSVTFLGNITLLGGYTFERCTSLTSFEIPNTVEQLGYGVFKLSGITELTIPTGIELKGTSSSTAIFSQSLIQKVNIDTDIPSYLFYDSDSLVSVVIGPNVRSIGNDAFSKCDGLVSISIPANVNTEGTPIKLGTYLFQDCTGLANVTLEEGITEIGNYTFQRCSSLRTITLPQSLTHIGTYCFSESGLETLTIPSGVKTLKSSPTATMTYSSTAYTFKGCENLREVIFPEGFEGMGAGVFQGCTSLVNVVLPDTTAIIGSNSFNGCTSLQKLTLPSSLDSLGYQAFADCTGIKKLVFKASPQTYFGTNVFLNWTKDQTVYFTFGEEETTNWTQTTTSSWASSSEATFVFNYVEA